MKPIPPLVPLLIIKSIGTSNGIHMLAIIAHNVLKSQGQKEKAQGLSPIRL